MDLHRVHYLDASVLVKLVLPETGTDTIKEYMSAESTSTFYATSLCFAEALGVLKSKYLRKEIDQETYFTAGDVLSAYISGDIELVDVDISDSAIFGEVEDVARRYRLDIVDAYQIVTIKKDYFSRSPHSKPFLVTADSGLAEAALKEGLRVWNCLTEQPP
jgi:predicted nucleic acid-binding protein